MLIIKCEKCGSEVKILNREPLPAPDEEFPPDLETLGRRVRLTIECPLCGRQTHDVQLDLDSIEARGNSIFRKIGDERLDDLSEPIVYVIDPREGECLFKSTSYREYAHVVKFFTSESSANQFVVENGLADLCVVRSLSAFDIGPWLKGAAAQGATHVAGIFKVDSYLVPIGAAIQAFSRR